MPATKSDFHFYADTFNKLSTALSSYVNDVATSVIAAITPVTTTLLLIYVCLWGWSVMRGQVEELVTDGLARMVRLSIITTLALSLGNYNGYVADFLWNAPDAMAAVVANGKSDPVANTQYLDVLMGKMYDLGDAYWQKAQATSGVVGIPDLGMTAVALLIWACGLISTGYAAFLLALSKMALAILAGIGPIFIVMLMFEPTKKFLDAWLGQALNYAFLTILTAAAIKLMMSIIEAYLGKVDSAGVLANPSIDQALPAIALCLITALVMVQLPSIASGLGGGVAMGTLGAAGWAYSKMKGSAQAGKDLMSGKTLNDMRANRRSKATNAQWAKRNPGRTAKAASALRDKVANRRNNQVSKAK